VLSRLTDSLKGGKDKALSLAIKKAINYKLKEIGEMLSLKLDSKEKPLDMEVMLEGEKEPLKVHIGNYTIDLEDGNYYLNIKDIATSRVWINTLIGQYFSQNRFEIPEECAKMLMMVV
jgi:hypothetical protein